MGRGALVWLALRNAGRNPTRSTLTIGLIAAASFIIIAISAFRLDPDADALSCASGTGGFALVAEADQPIHQDLNAEDGQLDLGLSSADRKSLADAHVFAMRMAGGDDASCLNLYQAAQPRVLGVPPSLVARGGFRWSATAAATPESSANPWLLLDQPPAAHDAADSQSAAIVPAILDEATAKYALHLSGVGDTYTITDGRGRPLVLQLVGLLSGSVLQGSLLISERNFLAHFPDTAGYRFFLIDAPADERAVPSWARWKNRWAILALTPRPPLRNWPNTTPCKTPISPRSKVWEAWGCCWARSASRPCNCAVSSSAARNWRCSAPPAFAALWWPAWSCWRTGCCSVRGLAIGCIAAFVAILPHILAGAAHLPWASTAATLALVLAVGLAAGMAAVNAAVRTPVLATLRGE